MEKINPDYSNYSQYNDYQSVQYNEQSNDESLLFEFNDEINDSGANTVEDIDISSRISGWDDFYAECQNSSPESVRRYMLRYQQEADSCREEGNESNAKLYEACVQELENLLPEGYLTQTNTDDSINVNEEINSFHQGTEGDCWLLASLKSYSSTEAGRQIIDDAITITEDGYKVSFKGINREYTFTSQDLLDANALGIYAYGDYDVTLIELAMEKALGEIRDGSIKIPNTSDIPDFGESRGEKSELYGGRLEFASYILTGDNVTKVFNPNYGKNGSDATAENTESFNRQAYDILQANQGNYAALISFYNDDKGCFANNTSGEKIALNSTSSHAWSVISVDDDTVTLVNPWNSDEEITFNKSDIEQYVYSIRWVDLSDN